MNRSFFVVLRLLFARLVVNGMVPQGNKVTFVVLSKDRPTQLDALLRSIKSFVNGHFSVYVLWRATSHEMASAYSEVLSLNSSVVTESQQESDFRQNLTKMLSQIKGVAVAFLVDDLLFVRPFDCRSLEGLNLWSSIPSLRLGRDISYCQPIQLHSPPPNLNKNPLSDWRSFAWTESMGDWAMPTSVDGNVFLVHEIHLLAKSMVYKAPNSLEKALGFYRFWFKFREGLCFEKPVIRNFAINRVQVENEDFPCGDSDPKMLLGKWEDGMQLDIEALVKSDQNSCHVVVDPVFENRS